MVDKIFYFVIGAVVGFFGLYLYNLNSSPNVQFYYKELQNFDLQCVSIEEFSYNKQLCQPINLKVQET